MPTMYELFDVSDPDLLDKPTSTFDEWIEQQEDGIAACDHMTFGRKVWEAAQQKNLTNGHNK